MAGYGGSDELYKYVGNRTPREKPDNVEAQYLQLMAKGADQSQQNIREAGDAQAANTREMYRIYGQAPQDIVNAYLNGAKWRQASDKSKQDYLLANSKEARDSARFTEEQAGYPMQRQQQEEKLAGMHQDRMVSEEQLTGAQHKRLFDEPHMDTEYQNKLAKESAALDLEKAKALSERAQAKYYGANTGKAAAEATKISKEQEWLDSPAQGQGVGSGAPAAPVPFQNGAGPIPNLPKAVRAPAPQATVAPIDIAPKTNRQVKAEAKFTPKPSKPLTPEAAEIQQLTLAEKRRKDAEATKPKTLQDRLNKMSAAEKSQFAQVSDGIAAIEDMDAALKAGDWTFRPPFAGDNNYTESERRFTEGLGRLESQGAINKQEIENFKAMVPRATDNADVQRRKIQKMRASFGSRAMTLGVDPKEVLQMRAQTQADQGAADAQRSGVDYSGLSQKDFEARLEAARVKNRKLKGGQ